MCVGVTVGVCMCLCVHIHRFACVSQCVCMHACMCTCVSVCMRVGVSCLGMMERGGQGRDKELDLLSHCWKRWRRGGKVFLQVFMQVFGFLVGWGNQVMSSPLDGDEKHVGHVCFWSCM